jgi:hypothetical protein
MDLSFLQCKKITEPVYSKWVAAWATERFLPERRTLILEELKYALEIGGKRRWLRGTKMNGISIVMRDEGFKVN